MLTTPEARPVALVAGASRGLGLLIARELIRHGYDVVICARGAEELAAATADLQDHGGAVHAEVCDVGDPGQVAALVASTESRIGPIDVLICVAGIIQVGPLSALRREHFEAAVRTMLWGPVNTALAVAPSMVDRRRGRIGVVTSVGGLIAAPHLLPYTTAKFGATGFSRGLRSELAGSGVTVTTIAPGLMRTGSHMRAEFLGAQEREYAWFATAASLPLLSINAERAARRIVAAVLSGRSFLTTTPLAAIAPRVDALFPRATSALLGGVAQLLPSAESAPADTVGTSGWRVEARLGPASRRVLAIVTTLGRRAARRFHQRRPAATRP